jgi:hypothetical protein
LVLPLVPDAEARRMQLPSFRVLTILTLATASVFAVAYVQPRAVTTTQRRDPVYAGLVGRWQGTVEVRDERVASRRVTRRTEVRVSPVPASDGLSMHVTTKDGADSVTTETDLLQLDKSLTAAQWGGMGDTEMQHYDVHVADSLTANSPLRLVLERERGGDDMPATIRETVTIAPGEIRIVQELREYGQQFEFQREYVLRRIG